MDAEEWEPLERGAGAGGWRGWLRRRLPVLAWAARYERTSAAADLVAGVTLGLTLVPQSIAYASLANLPVQYGLYSAFVGTFLYMFLGTVKEVSIGPTSLMALMTLQTCRELPVQFVVLLTFLSGCVVFLMGMLRLGFLVDLISPAVTSGFTSATAVIIVVAQLKGLLGLSFTAESPFENLAQIARRAAHVRGADCALAAACCATLLLLRKLKDIPVNPKRFRLKKTLWLISIARNALVVCAASTVAYCTYDPQRPLFKLSGRVEPGVPKISLPPFSATLGNRTVGFGEMVEELGSGLLMLPVVMVLANIAIAKAFSEGGRVDATQEMLTLGLCNVAGSLVHAMPTCGAFTRSAVSQSSGVRTPAAGLYSGVITLLALNYLTTYFFYIPKACLSSVLVCAVIFMVDVGTALRLGRECRREAAVLAGTFAVGVTGSVEAAVLGGVAASLALTLHALLRPPRLAVRREKWCGREVVRVQPRRALVYVNAERLAACVRGLLVPADPEARLPEPAGPKARQLLVPAGPQLPPAVLLDCSALALVDYTAAQVIGRLVEEFSAEAQPLVVYNASAEAARALRRVPGVGARALRERSARRALAEPTPGLTEADAPLAEHDGPAPV